MAQFRPQNLYRKHARGGTWGGNHYVPTTNIILQDPSGKTLVSIADSPSPMVLYL